MNKLKYINYKKIKSLKKITLTIISSVLIATTSIGCNKDDGADLDLVVSHNDKIFEIDEINPKLSLYNSDITDKDLLFLSPLTEEIYLDRCNYITSLDMLPSLCPNLKSITIYNCSSISNLDFIYNLPNLTYVDIKNCAFVSQQLVDYLNSHNITHTISEKDLYIANEIDKIHKEIITENMSDIDKIKAITLYIIKNYKYDITLTEESNIDPLDCMLTNKSGVCAGYSYLTNTLLRKGGINSYEVINKNHAWNLIEEDDKYYYLDVANLDVNCFYFNVKMFDYSPFFMSDPNTTNFSAQSVYNAGQSNIIMPKSFVEEIEKGEDLKTLNEKYGTYLVVFYLKIALPLLATFFTITTGKIFMDKKINNKIKQKDNNKKI